MLDWFYDGRGRLGLSWRVALGIVLTLWLGGLSRTALAGDTIYACDSERLGFGVTTDLSRYNLAPLHAGWYVNWGTLSGTAHSGGLDFAQILRVSETGFSPSGDALANVIKSSPASLWLIGNEPESPYQDKVTPETYARVYHDAYHFIKARDPLARVANGGFIQASPLRLKWLDRAWAEYLRRYGEPMPVDVWNIHTYMLREVAAGYGRYCAPPNARETYDWGAFIPIGLSDTCGQWAEINDHDRLDLLREQVVRFRTWMRDHGQQNKELIISEYGILFPERLGYTFDRVNRFMIGSFDYFRTARDPALGYPADDNRLVQRWAWYSLDDTSFEDAGYTWGALLDPATAQLTRLGQEFARYATPLAAECQPFVDLQPTRLQVDLPETAVYGSSVRLRVSLTAVNAGTLPARTTQVRFWRGDPAAGGTLLGQATLPELPARYEATSTATLETTVIAAGNGLVTAEIDAAGAVTESREDNNRVTTAFGFGSLNVQLGTAAWRLVNGPLRPGATTQLQLDSVQVTVTQPELPHSSVRVTPPTVRATWYDGASIAGEQAIAEVRLAADQFGQTLTVPAQIWAPLITTTRSVTLVAAPENGAPETDPTDSRASLKIPARADFVVLRAEVVGPRPQVTADGPQAVDVAVRFQVANQGTLPPAAPLEIAVWQQSQAVGVPQARLRLNADGDRTEPFVWQDLGVGVYPFVAGAAPGDGATAPRLMNSQLLVARAVRYLPLISH